MILFWAWEVLNLNLFNFGFWHVLANLGIFDLEPGFALLGLFDATAFRLVERSLILAVKESTSKVDHLDRGDCQCPFSKMD